MKNSANTTPQNIYDDPVFFSGYKTLRETDSGLNGVLEVPAFLRLLPNLDGLQILDLGCGFGHFARYAISQKAAGVVAIDVSEHMLEEAKKLTNDPAIAYELCAIEEFTPQHTHFDLVTSSLALHYVEDYQRVLARVFQALKPGGKFVFSVEHPMCTASPTGWIRDAEQHALYWTVDNYQQQGMRNTQWFVNNVRKFHRTMECYVNELLSAGFRLESLCEPTPIQSALETRPGLLDECRRPPFLLIAASKPASKAY